MNGITSLEDTEKERDAFVERLLASTAGTFDMFTLYIGDRLGFYRSLAEHGASTDGELASRTGSFERYVCEWLKQKKPVGRGSMRDASRRLAGAFPEGPLSGAHGGLA